MTRRLHTLLLTAAALLLTIAACTEKNPIDNYPVALRLDLTFSDKALRTVPSAITYTRHSHPQNNAYRAFGFGGVLVVHGIGVDNDGFYAFDLACPYENLRSVLVEPDAEVIYAICPQCGTKYFINDGSGAVVEGPSRHGLKRYNVGREGVSTLVVYN